MIEDPRLCLACPFTDRAECTAKCEAGNAGACSIVALQAEAGWEGPVDAPLAQRYYQKGCDGGSTYACTSVALCSIRGDVCAKDPKRASEIFVRQCGRGHAPSCYFNGRELVKAGSISAGFEFAERGCVGMHDAWGCRLLGKLCVEHSKVAPPNCLENARVHACEYGDSEACAGRFSEDD